MPKGKETALEIIDWEQVRRGMKGDSTIEFSEKFPDENDLSLEMLFSDTTTETPCERATPTEKGVSPKKMQAILEERARALARVAEVGEGEGMQLVVFSLANETYGIETDYVKEVQPLQHVSPVPCTPNFVVGVINIRGSIYSVVDIRGFFGVPRQEITDLTKVILVNAAGLEVGILADDVSGAVNVPLAEIKPPLAAQATVKEEYVQGVTKDMLVVLNLEALMRDERIIVHEEVA
jgi:purine-binding chemotaxis protein CheW